MKNLINIYQIFFLICLLSISVFTIAEEEFKPYEVYVSGSSNNPSVEVDDSQESESDDTDEYDGPSVEVVYVWGSPEVLMSGESDYIEAELGMNLQDGDKVKTDSNSYIEISFDEGEENVVRILEDSYAELLLEDDEKIKLLEGRVFSSIDNLPSGENLKYGLRLL